LDASLGNANQRSHHGESHYVDMLKYKVLTMVHFNLQVMKKAIYTSMRGNLQRRHTMMRLKLYAEDDIEPEIASKISSVIRQLRPIPERLDLMDEERVEAFPRVVQLDKDYVVQELKEYPNWESQHQKNKRQGKKK
jgi:D-arabinose 1-dehydrogenase-like Zn-dependent alcohol dehydrogenase